MAKTCPHCGTVLPPISDAFCVECREPLDEDPPAKLSVVETVAPVEVEEADGDVEHSQPLKESIKSAPSSDTSPADSIKEMDHGSSVAADGHDRLAGRTGVWILCGIAGFFGVMSLVTFVYQYNYTLPTGESYVETSPALVFCHLVRGLAFCLLSWRLFGYVRTISRVGIRDFQAISEMHASLWRCMATVAIVFLICQFLTVALVLA